jgi:hypothetical protein
MQILSSNGHILIFLGVVPKLWEGMPIEAVLSFVPILAIVRRKKAIFCKAERMDDGDLQNIYSS